MLQPLSLSFVVDVCIQLVSGVRHLHACRVLHRDLKSDNALVQSLAPLVVKWADFGVSVQLAAAQRSSYGPGGVAMSIPLPDHRPPAAVALIYTVTEDYTAMRV